MYIFCNDTHQVMFLYSTYVNICSMASHSLLFALLHAIQHNAYFVLPIDTIPHVTQLQWNFSIKDTIGTSQSVHNIEVSLLQRLISTAMFHMGTLRSVLIIVVSLLLRFRHRCLSVVATYCRTLCKCIAK